jgi:hypothetical protein
MTDDAFRQQLALVMAVTCVRNTVLEDYHQQGKLTQDEMRDLNREVANKLYTFLTYLFGPPSVERTAFFRAAEQQYPTTWDPPRLDDDFLLAIAIVLGRDQEDTREEDTP